MFEKLAEFAIVGIPIDQYLNTPDFAERYLLDGARVAGMKLIGNIIDSVAKAFVRELAEAQD